MRIEHLAIWVQNLEAMKTFYTTYFHCTSGQKYLNAKKNFESYFLSFQGGSRLELMHMPGIEKHEGNYSNQFIGITHFAISVGSKDGVDSLTERLRLAGCAIVGEPRTTGDGYYESVVLDPEQNRIEITI
ncbi:MAG TPA: VOC family protein [Chryseosolibacter sp.]